MQEVIEQNESIEDLHLKGYKIIQSQNGFRFGTDAVLLADFAKPKKGDRTIDLGTGTGIIPVIFCAKADIKEAIGIEIDKESANLAHRNVKLNNLEDKIKIVNEDLRNAGSYLPKNAFDLVVCNPPYTAKGSGFINKNKKIISARHELNCTLEDVIKASSELLRFGGRLCLIHRSDRLSDIVCLLRQYNIEAKRLRLVCPYENKEPSFILIEGRYGGKSGIKILPPLIMHTKSGGYTKELKEIYENN